MNKIIIADDHPIFRSGIKSIVEKLPNVELVGEAENGLEAYQLIIAKLPNIAILDLEMPLLTGLDVCKKVLNEKHFTKFIILTMHKEKEYFLDAVKSGVLGYLLKDNAIQDLETCIEEVSKGNTFISPTIKNYATPLNSSETESEFTLLIGLLTPTEKVIFKLISEGKTSAEIAELLFISANTVNNHRTKMTKKLNLNGEKNSLLTFAIECKELLKIH